MVNNNKKIRKLYNLFFGTLAFFDLTILLEIEKNHCYWLIILLFLIIICIVYSYLVLYTEIFLKDIHLNTKITLIVYLGNIILILLILLLYYKKLIYSPYGLLIVQTLLCIVGISGIVHILYEVAHKNAKPKL
jgi:hypothetical protein